MTYDYFIAARYRNKTEAIRLAELIRHAGHTAYCFAESAASVAHVGTVDSDSEQSMQQFEAIPDWQTDAGVREIFETDMQALRAAEQFILLLPAGKSAHIEAGVAYGLGKQLILIGEQVETESLYLIFAESYPTIEKFITSLASDVIYS